MRIDDRRRANIFGLGPEAWAGARARRAEDALCGVVIDIALLLRLQALPCPLWLIGDQERKHGSVLAEEFVHVYDEVLDDREAGERCNADALHSSRTYGQ